MMSNRHIERCFPFRNSLLSSIQQSVYFHLFRCPLLCLDSVKFVCCIFAVCRKWLNDNCMHTSIERYHLLSHKALYGSVKMLSHKYHMTQVYTYHITLLVWLSVLYAQVCVTQRTVSYPSIEKYTVTSFLLRRVVVPYFERYYLLIRRY